MSQSVGHDKNVTTHRRGAHLSAEQVKAASPHADSTTRDDHCEPVGS